MNVQSTLAKIDAILRGEAAGDKLELIAEALKGRRPVAVDPALAKARDAIDLTLRDLDVLIGVAEEQLQHLNEMRARLTALRAAARESAIAKPMLRMSAEQAERFLSGPPFITNT